MTTATGPSTLGHRPWPTPERTVVGRPGADLVLSNRSLLRRGRRWIPISGELHLTRLPRDRWGLALELLRAGGVDVVSTYVFWNHHQPSADRDPDFTGDRDVAAFVELCAAGGFPVVVRIGPWCHGEVRNGGLPDWVTASGHPLRTDSPGYLALVRRWFGFLGAQLAPLCRPGGPVIAIQAENELYADPEHLRTVKTLAQEAGIDAPLWTATGWGNAELPLPEVFPVYSGYADGFWVDAEAPWDDSFRSHFFFSDRWDDPGVGKDLAGSAWTGIAGAKHPDLPPATCELAGGMAAAYHCRPVPTGADIAALANVKLGSGSAWQGYYMYVGGTNPSVPGGLQESHATAYPNDLPTLNYDFHAPVGADLRVRESYHRLRLQHSFLAAFGDRLAGMTTTFPDDPATVAAPDADRGLRWCLRSDETSGFVFVNNHQPHEPPAAVPDVQFAVGLGESGPVRFPPTPVEVPTGAVWCLPVGLTVGPVDIAWATVTPLTLLSGAGCAPLLVAYAHPGLAPQLAVAGGPTVDLPVDGSPLTVATASGDRLTVLTLAPDEALHAWTPTVAGQRRSGSRCRQPAGGAAAARPQHGRDPGAERHPGRADRDAHDRARAGGGDPDLVRHRARDPGPTAPGPDRPGPTGRRSGTAAPDVRQPGERAHPGRGRDPGRTLPDHRRADPRRRRARRAAGRPLRRRRRSPTGRGGCTVRRLLLGRRALVGRRVRLPRLGRPDPRRTHHRRPAREVDPAYAHRGPAGRPARRGRPDPLRRAPAHPFDPRRPRSTPISQGGLR